MGLRVDQIRGGGFEAFSSTHALTELMLAASYRIVGSREGGATVGALWNHGSASASARGTDTSMALDRLALALDAHRAVWRRLNLFARVAGGAVRLKAGLAEGSVRAANDYGTDTTLTQTHWAPALEGAAGVALRVGELARPREHVFALWLTAEGGYGWAGSTALALAPNGRPAPARTDAPVQLGTVTPGGAFMSFAAALTF